MTISHEALVSCPVCNAQEWAKLTDLGFKTITEMFVCGTQIVIQDGKSMVFHRGYTGI